MKNNLENERKQFAALIALYVGEKSAGLGLYNDSFAIMKEITDFANTHDFDMIEEDGEYVIDAEIERDTAYKVASEIVEKLKNNAA